MWPVTPRYTTDIMKAHRRAKRIQTSRTACLRGNLRTSHPQSCTPPTPLSSRSLLITALAAAVPLLLSRFRAIRLPLVVGEIIAGIIIGKSGFNLVHHTPILDFLAEFGFTFLMFLSGLEVSFGALSNSLRDGKNRFRPTGPVPLALLSFCLTLLLALGAGFLLQRTGMTRNAILMGLILSTTSLGIVVPILKERGMNATPYGQLLLISALVADFATLLLLSITIGIISQGFGFEVLLFLVLLATFLVAARVGQWAKRIPGLARTIDELSHATAQLKVRGAFARGSARSHRRKRLLRLEPRDLPHRTRKIQPPRHHRARR